MKNFQPYADQLTDLVRLLATSEDVPSSVFDAVDHALDGEAASYLRKAVTLGDLRAAGAFFTSSALALTAWKPLINTLNSTSVVVDPACGAGNLLLPVVPYLSATSDSSEQLASRFGGVDVSAEFVNATRARLALASLRHNRQKPGLQPITAESFAGIFHGDLFEISEDIIARATHIALNPPYVLRPASKNCEWATGGVNSAATFLSFCLERMRSDARMVAILPDVLRSGSRYRRWRDYIEARATVHSVNRLGQFDARTDVHVFLLYLMRKSDNRVGTTKPSGLRIASLALETDTAAASLHNVVGGRFKVSVGTVVQYRHPEVGISRCFASARGLQLWAETTDLPRRRFSGRCDMPPFVVVRRTSRPGEPYRARATIISGREPVAVDNHLLVLTPVDAALESCRELVEVLRRPETTRWLDRHFRCRHLTVGALVNLPWPSGDSGSKRS